MAKRRKKDKSKLTRLIALILCVLLVVSAVVGAIVSLAYAEETSGGSTEITLTVEEGAQGLRAFQVTRYVNETGTDLGRVIFSLGANAYRRLSTAPFENEELDAAYPRGFETGGIQIDRITVDGQEADWGVQGTDESFLSVECSLAPGDSACFTFEYRILLPYAMGLFGTGEMGWRLSFFAPSPCPYDNAAGEFVCVPLKAFGDSIFLKPQDFFITIDAPETYLIAAGGEKSSAAAEDGRSVTVISVQDASSPALAMSRRYTLYEDVSSGTDITCLANTATGAKRVLEKAGKIIKVYEERLGSCPVGQLCIAQTDALHDLDAFDGLLMLNKDLLSLNRSEELEKALANGIAKQWFGLSVRNDPENEPWLSEAVCSYMALLYYEEAYGHERFLKELNDQVLDALNVTLPGGLTPDTQRSLFSTGAAYDMIVRDRGTAVLHEIRQVTGEDGFWAALKTYYDDQKGKTAGIREFEQALQQAAGKDLAKALEYHLLNISDYVNQHTEWIE